MSFILLDQTPKRLVIEELLDAPLEQKFTVIDQKIIVERFLPYLFIKGSPEGTLKLELYRKDTLAWSSEQSIASIIAQSGKSKTTYHGYITFKEKPAILEKSVDYKLVLSSSDYSFGDSHYIGWVRPHDPRTIYRHYSPLDFQIIEIRNA